MARYIVDANLPSFLPVWSGVEFEFVTDIDRKWSDQKIWNYAWAHGLTIITKDSDFTDRVFLNPDGPHVIHMRVGNMKIRALEAFLNRNWELLRVLSAQHQLVAVYGSHFDCIT